MKFPFEYQRPEWGPRARAVPAGSEANRELSPLPPVKYPPAYPAPRERPEGVVDARYPRYQSNTVTLAATTEFQEVIRFAGRPDRIDYAASAAGVEVRFRNRGETATDAIRVPSAQFHDTDLSKEIMEARDPTGAGGQLVTAHGMWFDRPTT